jgi:hypothetical protein
VYHIASVIVKKGRSRTGNERTDAMKRPKAPPRANPITPETAVFPGQDSIKFFIFEIL